MLLLAFFCVSRLSLSGFVVRDTFVIPAPRAPTRGYASALFSRALPTPSAFQAAICVGKRYS